MIRPEASTGSSVHAHESAGGPGVSEHAQDVLDGPSGLPPDATPEPAAQAPAPPVPDSIEDTGLSTSQVSELVLKTLYQHGNMRGDRLAGTVALPFHIIDDLLVTAQRMHLVEVPEALAHGRNGYTFALTSEGRERARAALESSQYIGPAPVPLEQFARWVEIQSVTNNEVSRKQLEDAMSDLVLPAGIFKALGPALNSGGSIFLHGAPGNGKTSIAERLGALTSTSIYLPRAVMVNGNVMVLYDSIYHELVEEEPESGHASALVRSKAKYDARFVHVKRPTVFVGGELTMEQLDVQFDPYTKIYQAPFQLKAAGGVLLIDDFGRQRMRPEEILSRWIVPLEKGFDNLSFRSGIKFPVPFDCLLIFATNLNPGDLVDEAFLRRIQYKVEIKSPDRAAFEEIFRLNCDQLEIEFEPRAIDLLYNEYYEAHQIAPRGCHPRDILKRIQAVAEYEGLEPRLEPDALRQAVDSYFLVLEEEYQAGIPTAIHNQGDEQ